MTASSSLFSYVDNKSRTLTVKSNNLGVVVAAVRVVLPKHPVPFFRIEVPGVFRDEALACCHWHNPLFVIVAETNVCEHIAGDVCGNTCVTNICNTRKPALTPVNSC